MDNHVHNATIYAIRDNVAEQIIGTLIMLKHEAAAVRSFGDIASMPESIVGKHPADFDLVQLGYITHTHQLEPDYRLVITGAAWLAAQEKNA